MATCGSMKTARRVRQAILTGKLLARQRDLIAREQLAERVRESGAKLQSADDSDRAIESSQEELTQHVMEIRSEEALQINEALQKVFDGTYGHCESCGKRIPAARLKLLPSATLCVSCRKEIEREQMSDEWSADWEGVSGEPADDAERMAIAGFAAQNEI